MAALKPLWPLVKAGSTAIGKDEECSLVFFPVIVIVFVFVTALVALIALSDVYPVVEAILYVLMVGVLISFLVTSRGRYLR